MEKITVLQENNDQELVANHSPESAFNLKLREYFNNRHFLVHNRTIFSKRASLPSFIYKKIPRLSSLHKLSGW